MSEIQRDREPAKSESQREINQTETLGNLGKILEELKKGKVPEKKMELIVDYVLKLSQIESKYSGQKANLKTEIRQFLKSSLQDNLAEHLGEFNISRFDIDGHEGLDEVEQSNYSRALGEAIQKIIILGGIDRFSDIHEDSSSKNGFSNVDKYLASKLDLAKLVMGEKGEKGFTSEMIQRYGNITEKEFKEMQESKFNTLSTNSWGDLGVLLVKEFGDGVEDVLRFLANIPASTILIPRYLKYRVDINSDDEITRTEGEIKMQELVKENPSLAILDMLGEKGIEMLKHLAEMLTSGKTGDIATALVMLAGLVAGGAGVARIGLKLARKQAVMSARGAGFEARLAGKTSSRAFRSGLRSGERGASRVGEIASNIDDIVGGAGMGHIIGAISNKFVANDNIIRATNDNVQVNSVLADGTTGLPIHQTGNVDFVQNGSNVGVNSHGNIGEGGVILGRNNDIYVNGKVDPKKLLNKLKNISERLNSKHPTTIGIVDGTFGLGETLKIDEHGNVILTRVAMDRNHLLKTGQRSDGVNDLLNTSESHGGGNGLPTSSLSGWEDNFNSSFGERVVGTFRIPAEKLIELFEQEKATIGNLGEGEIVLDPSIAEYFLSEVKNIGENLIDPNLPREIIIDFPSKTEKLGNITYSFEKGVLQIHDFNSSGLSKEQAYEKILGLITEVSEKKGEVKTLDFSLKMTPELHKVLNEIISGNYPALSIERLVSGQRVVDIAFSGGKHINDNLSKEICDLVVARFKEKVNKALESSNLSGNERNVRSDYKHDTTSLNKEEDFINALFGKVENRKDFVKQVLSSFSGEELLQMFSTIPEDRLAKLSLTRTSSIEEIKKVIFSDIENNFDFGIGTSVLGDNATLEEKMLAFYKAETSAKRGVESGKVEAKVFSFERIMSFSKRALESKETIIKDFKNGFIEINGERCKIIITDLRTGEPRINKVILRYVRKDGILPNEKLQQLVKNYISQLNEGFDFISPKVKGVEVDIGEINRAVRDGKIDVEYLTHNNKGTHTRKALETKIEGKPGTRGFLDVVDMGLENLDDFDELAQKVLSGEITEAHMMRLLDAGGSVTAKFQKLVKSLKSEGIELSLGGDEVFMYSEKLSPDEMARIVSENVERVGLRGRFTSSTNPHNAREVFESLDKQTGLIKPIEQYIEGIIMREMPGIRIPSNISIRNLGLKEIPIDLGKMVNEEKVLILYEKGEVEIGNGITLIKEGNQITININ